MSNPHDHDHDQHTEESVTAPPRQLTRAENKQREIRTKAIESLLLEKQLVTVATLDAVIKTYEDDLGPLNGAKVVARAWVDQKEGLGPHAGPIEPNGPWRSSTPMSIIAA